MPYRSTPSLNTASRYAAVDMLRGLAMVWMTVFHFCFDLQHFGFVQTDFYGNPVWTVQRMAIVTLFVLCAGLGQSIALQQGQSSGRFWKRWRQIALCALAVSLGSWFMFPNSYIYFGILHGMALMLILVRFGGASLGRWLWPLGALAMLMPRLAMGAHAQWPDLDFLNQRAWNWLGLISYKPITEDYAPLFPWIGVMCWGLALGQWVLRRHAAVLERVGGVWAASVVGVPLRGLAFLGRWSLSYYMLHQPVLIGVLSLVALVR